MLCYHGVSADAVDTFRSQLEVLLQMGFTSVGFDEGFDAIMAGSLSRPIMTVTFDDGYSSVYENALPVLEELGIRAFLYVTADYIRKGVTYRDELPLSAMTWQQVREWLGAGHGVGSHTLTHAPLRLCSDSRLHQECAQSKAILEDNLQVPIRHLSYPWGQHSGRTHRLIEAQNLYDTAATIDRGGMRPGHDRWKLRRDACDPSIPVGAMLRIIRAADRYYWLRHFRRKPTGYWERHPEETWDALEDTT